MRHVLFRWNSRATRPRLCSALSSLKSNWTGSSRYSWNKHGCYLQQLIKTIFFSNKYAYSHSSVLSKLYFMNIRLTIIATLLSTQRLALIISCWHSSAYSYDRFWALSWCHAIIATFQCARNIHGPHYSITYPSFTLNAEEIASLLRIASFSVCTCPCMFLAHLCYCCCY